MSVPVSRDVFMQVGQAVGCRLSDVAQLVPRHHVGLQVVCQRALGDDTDTDTQRDLLSFWSLYPHRFYTEPLGSQ